MMLTPSIHAMSSAARLEQKATARTRVIVNADDFGRSDGVNAGVLQACQTGIVRSASLMVRWPSTLDAVAISNECCDLSLGLHLDLGEWTLRDGQWATVYEVVPLDDAAGIASEIARQVEHFQDLTGRNPSHVDSHQHVHRNPLVHAVVVAIARRLGVPLRHFDPTVRYCGDFYGQSKTGDTRPQDISVDALVALLSQFEPGVNELSCHPALEMDFDTMYRDERMLELKSLCDERVQSAVDRFGIELLSFSNLAACNENRQVRAGGDESKGEYSK